MANILKFCALLNKYYKQKFKYKLFIFNLIYNHNKGVINGFKDLLKFFSKWWGITK